MIVTALVNPLSAEVSLKDPTNAVETEAARFKMSKIRMQIAIKID